MNLNYAHKVVFLKYTG